MNKKLQLNISKIVFFVLSCVIGLCLFLCFNNNNILMASAAAIDSVTTENNIETFNTIKETYTVNFSNGREVKGLVVLIFLQETLTV